MYDMNKPFLNISSNKKINVSCQVLLIYPGKGTYDYRMKNSLEIGQLVSVPSVSYTHLTLPTKA